MFDLSQLKVIDGKRLVTAPHRVMEELQDFLGIERELGEGEYWETKLDGRSKRAFNSYPVPRGVRGGGI